MSQLNIVEDELYFFLDETGDIACNDPNNKIFALGGYAIMGYQYQKIINDWQKIQNNKPFHANKVRRDKMTKRWGGKLGVIFQTQEIYRFAVLKKESTSFFDGAKQYWALAECMKQGRFHFILSQKPELKKAHFIFEHAVAYEEKVQEHFGNEFLIINDREIECEWYWGIKSLKALEIADAVMNAVQRQARMKYLGETGWDIAFQKVFHGINRMYCSFIDIDKVEHTVTPELETA